MNKLNLGIGISGLSVNVLRIICLASVKSQSVSAQIFFYTTGAYLCMCTVLAFRFISQYQIHETMKSTQDGNGYALAPTFAS